jgi:putative membrane protein
VPLAYGDINSHPASEGSRSIHVLPAGASINNESQKSLSKRGIGMGKQKSVVRGILAGMAGGLAATWVINQFMAGPAQELQHAVQSAEENREQQATMKAAEAIVPTEEENGSPIVHYAFGALGGGFYGALAEYSSTVTSGFGTSFGGALLRTAVPSLTLAPSPGDQPALAQASPFAAHIVYGATTEFVRRIVRSLL